MVPRCSLPRCNLLFTACGGSSFQKPQLSILSGCFVDWLYWFKFIAFQILYLYNIFTFVLRFKMFKFHLQMVLMSKRPPGPVHWPVSKKTDFTVFCHDFSLHLPQDFRADSVVLTLPQDSQATSSTFWQVWLHQRPVAHIYTPPTCFTMQTVLHQKVWGCANSFPFEMLEGDMCVLQC